MISLYQVSLCNLSNRCNQTPRFAISLSCAIYVIAIFDAIFSFLSLSGCFFYRYPLRSKIKVSFVIIFLLVVIIMFTRFMFHQYPRFMFCILASISLHKPFVSFAFSSNHITTQLYSHKLNRNFSSSSLLSS